MGIKEELLKIKEKAQQNSTKNTLNSSKESTYPESKCKYGCENGVIITKTGAMQCRCIVEKAVQKKAEEALKFANIPEQFKGLDVNSFRTDIYSHQIDESKAKIAKLATINFKDNFELYAQNGVGLYFYSETPGSGKSRMAMSLANDLVKEKNEQVKYTTVSDLFDTIKGTFNTNSRNTSDELIDAIRITNVLILDEVGVEKVTDWVEEVFFGIINDRVSNNRITIFTSNKRIEELNYTARTKSRIKRSTELIAFPEEDVRNKIGNKKKEELRKLLLQKRS